MWPDRFAALGGGQLSALPGSSRRLLLRNGTGGRLALLVIELARATEIVWSLFFSALKFREIHLSLAMQPVIFRWLIFPAPMEARLPDPILKLQNVIATL